MSDSSQESFYSTFLYNAYHGAAILIWVYFVLYLLSVIGNFSSILKIKVFTIKPMVMKEMEAPLDQELDVENGKTSEIAESQVTEDNKVVYVYLISLFCLK